MKTRVVAAATLMGICLSLLSGCRTAPGPAQTPQPSPPPELIMDEGALPADLSGMDYWNGGAPDGLGCYDGRSADLSGETLPEGPDRLMLLQFDSRTRWPDPLPDGFDPDAVMEANKNPGLGVRALHARGITGEGVNLGIIDQNLLLEHVEYRDNVLYHRQLFKGHNTASMHGAGVASIAVGRTVGVAPGANLYYVSHDVLRSDEDPESIRPYIEALNTLLDLNDTLPEAYRLDVISISHGFNETDENWDQMKAALDRAEQADIFVVTASSDLTHGMPIAGASRVPLSDYDDPGNTRPGLYASDRFYSDPGVYLNKLFIPVDFRAIASPTGPEDYVNYTGGAMSWAVPYFAGVYCLAKQVKPDVTPEEFWSAAMSTARHVTFDRDGSPYGLRHVIDPAGIVDALRAQ